jgi:hypothetical protein
VHLAFSAESGYYDAIISLTLAFLLPAFAERPLSFGAFAESRTL